MGATESTTRSNATKEEEEKRKQENNTSVGSSIAVATAVATVAAGAVGVAWGISKMLSNNTESQESNHQVQTQQSLLYTPRIYEERTTPRIYEGRKQRSIWSPPPYGGYKMNTDGACHPMRQDGVQRGPSGYGGVLRDHHGNWVRGFIGYINESDILTCELQGILRGLELLDQLNIEHAILETDSQAAHEFVTRHDEYRRQKQIVQALLPTIERCRELAGKNGVTIELVPGKDANQCADKLADMGIARKIAYMELKDVPSELKYLVEKDAKVNG